MRSERSRQHAHWLTHSHTAGGCTDSGPASAPEVARHAVNSLWRRRATQWGQGGGGRGGPAVPMPAPLPGPISSAGSHGPREPVPSSEQRASQLPAPPGPSGPEGGRDLSGGRGRQVPGPPGSPSSRTLGPSTCHLTDYIANESVHVGLPEVSPTHLSPPQLGAHAPQGAWFVGLRPRPAPTGFWEELRPQSLLS